MTDNFELDGYQVPVLIIHNGRLVPTGKMAIRMSEARDLVPEAIRAAERRFTRYPDVKNVWGTFWVPVVINQQFIVGFRNTFGSITIQVWEAQCYDNFDDIMMRKDAQPIVLIYEEVQQHTKPVFTRYQNNRFQSAWSLAAPNVWTLSSLNRVAGKVLGRNRTGSIYIFPTI